MKCKGKIFSVILALILLSMCFPIAANAAPANINVSIMVIGDDVHGARSHRQYQMWINRTDYTIPDGSSAYDLIIMALNANGMRYEIPWRISPPPFLSSHYVASITAPSVWGGHRLAEFSNGGGSGWMISSQLPGRNHEMSNPISVHGLTEGEFILVRYVDDYNALEFNPDPPWNFIVPPWWTQAASTPVVNSGNGGGSARSNSLLSGGYTAQGGSGSIGGAALNNTMAIIAATAAANAAKASGAEIATVKLKNVGEVSPETFKAMADAAGMPVQFHADSMNADATVDVRITLDPAKVTENLNLLAFTNNTRAQKTKAHFEKFFSNALSVVSLAQQGSFGQPVAIVAKTAPGQETGNLVFYAYDRAANTYKRIENPNYRTDKNGYTHLTTELAGDIIISDGALARKGQN